MSSPSPPRRPPVRRTETETGMILMVTAMVIVPGLDACAKLLSAWMSPGQVSFARFVLQALFLGGFLAVQGKLRRPVVGFGPLMASGLFVSLAILAQFWALTRLPLANAIAIFFVEPLILVLLSAWFLKEQVGWRRYAAVAVGLVGALVVVRPNWVAFGWHAVLPLIAAVFFAAYLMNARRLSGQIGGVALQAWSGIFAMIFLGVGLVVGTGLSLPPLTASVPPLVSWPVILGLGVIATGSHLLIVLALKRVEASLLAPFQYLEIISATALGYLLFGDFPDALTWLGTAIILGAGLYVFSRERATARGKAG